MKSYLLQNLVSYEKLDQLLSGITDDMLIKENKINVFIDLTSVYNHVYKDEYIEDIKLSMDENKNVFVENLINLIAHYRQYIYTRKNSYSDFYILYSNGTSEYHLEIDDKYKREYYDFTLNDNSEFSESVKYFRNNIDAFKTMNKYIPNVFTEINTNTDELLLPYLIIKQNNLENKVNMIISHRDLYSNYVSYFPNTYILNQKSIKNKFINKDNVMQHAFKGVDKFVSNIGNNINNYMQVFNSILGNERFGILGIKGLGVKKLVNAVYSIIEKNSKFEFNLGIDGKSINEQIYLISQELKLPEDNIQQIQKNMKLTSPLYYYKYTKRDKVISFDNKSPSYSSMVFISETYFNNLLNLKGLFMGERKDI